MFSSSPLTILKDSSEQVHYNDPAVPLYVTHGDLISYKNLRAHCHWHEDIEFLLPVKGHISYQVNEKEYFIEEGQCIFVNSRQLHYGFSPDGNDCFYICILVKASLLAGNEELYQRYFSPLLDQQEIPAVILTPENALHQPVLQALYDVYALYHPTSPFCVPSIYHRTVDDALIETSLCPKKEDCPELLAMGSLLMVWKYLLQIMTSQNPDSMSGSRADANIQKQILSFMYENVDQKISLNDLARAGGVSRTKCCQLFQTFFNRTPIDYLNSYRLEKSMEMLTTTKYSVTEISALCGFGTSSYFAEMFRKYKGCSPSEFRKMSRRQIEKNSEFY